MENKQEFLNEQLTRFLGDSYIKKEALQKLQFLINKGADVSVVKKIRSFENHLSSFINIVSDGENLEEDKREQLDNILVQFTENIEMNDYFVSLMTKLSHNKLFKTLKSLLVKYEKEITYNDYCSLVKNGVFSGYGNTGTLDCLSESYAFHDEYLKRLLETGSYTFHVNICDDLLKYLIKKNANLFGNKKIVKNIFDNCFNRLSCESLEILYDIIQGDRIVPIYTNKINKDVKEVVNELEKEEDDEYELIQHIQKHGSLPPGFKFVPNE